jgi:AbrB family looped-hinge helix DNA binding protein
MSKVTSKLQVTLPKAIAEQLGIRPGDEINWEISGDAMRVIPATKKRSAKKNNDPLLRLRLFDHATRRQQQRETSRDRALMRTTKAGRGWTREELYSRGGTDRH